MTPKEKAKELFSKYMGLGNECNCLEYMCVCFTMYPSKAKQGALICVDEILNILPEQVPEETYYEGEISVDWFINDEKLFWQEVKQEIEKL